MITYRQANHEDLSYLIDLEKELDKGKPDSPFWENMGVMTSVMTSPMLPLDRVTVAEERDGVPIAMVGSVPVSADVWYLVNLYVSPGYRGRGIAKGLLAKAAERQRELGRTTALAIVADKVGDLYDHLGFKQHGRAMGWSHD